MTALRLALRPSWNDYKNITENKFETLNKINDTNMDSTKMVDVFEKELKKIKYVAFGKVTQNKNYENKTVSKLYQLKNKANSEN